MKTQKEHFKINGYTKYFFSKFSNDKVPKTDDAMTRVAMNKVYQDEKGNLYIPGRQIKAAIKTAINLADMKLQKSKLKAIQLVDALVFISPENLLLKRAGKQITVKDVKMADIPTQTGIGMMKKTMTIVRNSYIDEGWELEFDIAILAENILDMGYVKDALNNAATLTAIGAKRNQGYGKFSVCP